MSAHPPIRPFSQNPDFDYEIRCVIGQAHSGAADVGEVLAAVSAVHPKDHEGWFSAWLGLADRVAASAAASAAAGHRRSAAFASLRASSYYGVAVNAIAALESDDRLGPTFTRQADEWSRFIDLSDLGAQRLAIPYENTTLPGYFFPASDATTPTRTLIGVNGSDGPLASMWSNCAWGAHQRGYHVLLFDGPGQQSMLFEADTSFRPDWEAVLTPVIDALVARPDVDADRIAVYGVSQAGYWVSRALAFEHRPAAAIVDPGVVDVSTSWTAHVPGPLRSMLEAGKNEEFDHDMGLGMRLSPETARTWKFRARPYGTGGYAAVLHELEKYRVHDVAGQITTPLLVTSPEGEQFWPGQSQRLHELTPSVSSVVTFSATEGADLHCQPLARALTDQVMFDWLDERLA